MVFPVVMYRCESWVIKKADSQRIDAFELWSWRRLLRVPWTARRSNQLILKEIHLEYSLAGLMLKLKLQYFGHLIHRADSLEKTLMLGKIEGRRREGRQRMFFTKHHWLSGHEFEQTPADSEGQGSMLCCSTWGLKDWMQLSNWKITRDGARVADPFWPSGLCQGYDLEFSLVICIIRLRNYTGIE